MRLNNAASPASSVYALDITNQRSGLSTSPPLTKPIISNVTVLGPNYCSGTAVNVNFAYAVRLGSNAAGKIYNSVFSSWNTSALRSGLLIDGVNSIANTASDDLEFSFNSFHSSGSTPYISNPSAWNVNGGCDATMADWITGSGVSLCIEDGNQFSVAALGYNTSFCGNFYSRFSSNFTLGTTTLPVRITPGIVAACSAMSPIVEASAALIQLPDGRIGARRIQRTACNVHTDQKVDRINRQCLM